jgi:hypothetical protein
MFLKTVVRESLVLERNTSKRLEFAGISDTEQKRRGK